MTPKWVAAHQPVLSRHSNSHVLYTKFDITEPGGQLVICQNRVCQPLDMSYSVRSQNVRFICGGCGWRCSAPKLVSDNSTFLGRCELVKTDYPQKQLLAEWTRPQYPPLQNIIDSQKQSPPLRSKVVPVIAAPATVSRSASLPLSGPTPSPLPSSSSLKIRIPPLRYAPPISRAKSAPQPDEDQGETTITPPHPSPSGPNKKMVYPTVEFSTVKRQSKRQKLN